MKNTGVQSASRLVPIMNVDKSTKMRYNTIR